MPPLELELCIYNQYHQCTVLYTVYMYSLKSRQVAIINQEGSIANYCLPDRQSATLNNLRCWNNIILKSGIAGHLSSLFALDAPSVDPEAAILLVSIADIFLVAPYEPKLLFILYSITGDRSNATIQYYSHTCITFIITRLLDYSLNQCFFKSHFISRQLG